MSVRSAARGDIETHSNKECDLRVASSFTASGVSACDSICDMLLTSLALYDGLFSCARHEGDHFRHRGFTAGHLAHGAAQAKNGNRVGDLKDIRHAVSEHHNRNTGVADAP